VKVIIDLCNFTLMGRDTCAKSSAYQQMYNTGQLRGAVFIHHITVKGNVFQLRRDFWLHRKCVCVCANSAKGNYTKFMGNY